MTREEAAIDYCLFIGNTSLDEVDAFKAGAEWEHKRLVEKACEWLENKFVCFLQGAKRGIYSNQFITVNEMVDSFKRTMEE